VLTLKHLGALEAQNPLLGETLRAIQVAINQGHATVGVDPTGKFPAPSPPSALAVTALNGWFDAVITDPNPQRGVFYHIDFDTVASFPAPRTQFNGSSRTWYVQLGNQTLFWRVSSQYLGSDQSPYIYFGTQAIPTAVIGGGASGPAPMPSQGTGAGPSAGGSPNPPVGVGFGPVRRLPPPRNLPGGRNTQ